LDAENHREKRSLAGLMSCIFNAAANSEHGKDVEDWVRAEKELRDEPVGVPAKTRAAQAVRNLPN
jgi:hypothetical protein